MFLLDMFPFAAANSYILHVFFGVVISTMIWTVGAQLSIIEPSQGISYTLHDDSSYLGIGSWGKWGKMLKTGVIGKMVGEFSPLGWVYPLNNQPHLHLVVARDPQ